MIMKTFKDWIEDKLNITTMHTNWGYSYEFIEDAFNARQAEINQLTKEIEDLKREVASLSHCNEQLSRL